MIRFRTPSYLRLDSSLFELAVKIALQIDHNFRFHSPLFEKGFILWSVINYIFDLWLQTNQNVIKIISPRTPIDAHNQPL